MGQAPLGEKYQPALQEGRLRGARTIDIAVELGQKVDWHCHVPQVAQIAG